MGHAGQYHRPGISRNACHPLLSPRGPVPSRLASAGLASFSCLGSDMPGKGGAPFGGFFLFCPEMGTLSTGKLNQGCYVWCLSRCPRTHKLCSMADSPNKSLCLYETDTLHFKVALLFAVTQRRFNGSEFFLGWVLESFKPNALQEKAGQAATEEIQTGGWSQMA